MLRLKFCNFLTLNIQNVPYTGIVLNVLEKHLNFRRTCCLRWRSSEALRASSYDPGYQDGSVSGMNFVFWPAFSYEHNEFLLRKSGVKRDLGNRTILVNRDHMKKHLSCLSTLKGPCHTILVYF